MYNYCWTAKSMSSPFVLACRSDGSLRFCKDYCTKLSLTTRDAYHLLSIEETIDSLCGATSSYVWISSLSTGRWKWSSINLSDGFLCQLAGHWWMAVLSACNFSLMALPSPKNVCWFLFQAPARPICHRIRMLWSRHHCRLSLVLESFGLSAWAPWYSHLGNLASFPLWSMFMREELREKIHVLQGFVS